MSSITIGFLGIGMLLGSIFLGAQIMIAMTTVGFVGLALITNFNAALSILGTIYFDVTNSFHFSVIPMSVHVPARCGDIGLVPLEIEIEMRQSVVFDVAGRIAQGFEFRQFGGHSGTLVDKAGADIGHRPLQLGIG